MISAASKWRSAIAAALVTLGSLAVALGPAFSAHADAGGYLSIVKYQQNQSNWCWAAAAETAIQYLTGKNIAQCGLVSQEMASTSCANVQASDAQVRNLLLMHLSAATISTGHLTYATLGNNVNAGRPVLAHIQWTGGGGHMVTIFSYENATNSGNAAGTIIDYANSDGAVGNGTNATVSSRSLSNFWSNTSFSQYSSLIGIHA